MSSILRKGALFLFACAALGAGFDLVFLSLKHPNIYSLCGVRGRAAS